MIFVNDPLSSEIKRKYLTWSEKEWNENFNYNKV